MSLSWRKKVSSAAGPEACGERDLAGSSSARASTAHYITTPAAAPVCLEHDLVAALDTDSRGRAAPSSPNEDSQHQRRNDVEGQCPSGVEWFESEERAGQARVRRRIRLMSVHFRPMEAPADLPQVVNLYNEAFGPLRPVHSWPITVERFQDKVIECWEYRPDGCWVAADGDRLVGFVVASCRKIALTDQDRANVAPPVAFISAIAVDPGYRRRAIGRALLDKAESFARSHGCRMITPGCNPASPMAFFVAPQTDWVDGLTFLKACGYEPRPNAWTQNGVRSLAGFEMDPWMRRRMAELSAAGYECRPYRDEDHGSLVESLGWPYWVLDMESKFGRWHATRPFIETCFLGCSTEDIYGPDEIGVVVKDGRVLSFCAQTLNLRTGWAYLGPVQTQSEAENQGLGSVALQISLQQAAAKGATWCDVWTDVDEHHTRFYGKNGFAWRMRFVEFAGKRLAGQARMEVWECGGMGVRKPLSTREPVAISRAIIASFRSPSATRCISIETPATFR